MGRSCSLAGPQAPGTRSTSLIRSAVTPKPLRKAISADNSSPSCSLSCGERLAHSRQPAACRRKTQPCWPGAAGGGGDGRIAPNEPRTQLGSCSLVRNPWQHALGACTHNRLSSNILRLCPSEWYLEALVGPPSTISSFTTSHT